MMPIDSNQPRLRIRQVSKHFGSRGFRQLLRRSSREITALAGVDLELAAGEITALLGPNGAGKTTLMAICCDIVRADTGTVVVDGFDTVANGRKARRRIGLVTTDDRSFFWRLSARENLQFFAALQGLDRGEAKRRSEDFLERFGLKAHADRRFATYSTGMKKRLSLARALLHKPSVLLLDEATNGLDVEGTDVLLDLVKHEATREGAAVLWATHRAEELAALCDRVTVLVGGQLRYDGRIDEFLEFQRQRTHYRIEVAGEATGNEALESMARAMGLTVQGTGHRTRLTGDASVSLADVVAQLAAGGFHVRGVEQPPTTLAQLFTDLAPDRETS